MLMTGMSLLSAEELVEETLRSSRRGEEEEGCDQTDEKGGGGASHCVVYTDLLPVNASGLCIGKLK